jgi:hypothetical protein
MRDVSDFDKVSEISADYYWGEAVNKARSEIIEKQWIGMSSLDMETLDQLVAGKPDKGIRLSDKEIMECTQSDLMEAGLRFGGPFGLLAGIPKLVKKEFELEVFPTLKSELDSSMYPKMINLTLSIIGLLSMIATAAALLLKGFSDTIVNTQSTGNPFIDRYWYGVMFIMFFVMAIIVYPSWRKLSKLPHYHDAQKIVKNFEGKINLINNDINKLRAEVEKLKKSS